MNKYDIQYIDLDNLMLSMMKVPGKNIYLVSRKDLCKHITYITLYGNSKDEALFKFLSKFSSNKSMHISARNCSLQNWFWSSFTLLAKVLFTIEDNGITKIRGVKGGYIIFRTVKNMKQHLFRTELGCNI